MNSWKAYKKQFKNSIWKRNYFVTLYVTFDELNASLLNRSINLLTPNVLKGSVNHTVALYEI